MLVSSRYGGFGRGIYQSLLDGTITIKGAGTCLRVVVCQGQVIEQVQRTANQCTIIRHGKELIVKENHEIVKHIFYEPGSLRAIRRGGLWKKETNLTLCGASGVLECHSTPRGLYAKEVFTYANGVRAYLIERGQTKLEVYRPTGTLWMVLEGRVRPGFHSIIHWLEPETSGVGLLGIAASWDLKVTVYGPSGRVITQGAYVSRQRQGRWLEKGKVWYYLSGVKVSRQLGEEDPDQWEAWEVLRIPNAQLRSSFLNKMGYERLLQKVGHEVIDTDTDGSQLLAITIAPGESLAPGLDPIMRLLRVVCPSTHATYILRVPPEVQSCQEARHWTLGLDLDSVQDGTRFHLVRET